MSLSPGAAAVPIVSLTTDFGLGDPFVGLLHARVLGECPAARIVDLTHAIPAGSVEVASFWTSRCHRYFPAGTVHVVVVDPGVGTDRGILVLRLAGQLFVAPDNGVLAALAGEAGAEVRQLDPTLPGRLGLGKASATFHGRDVFAPLAGMLAAGRISFEDTGSLVRDWQPGPALEVIREGGRIHGRVILVDSFGNCFSNLSGELLAGPEDWEVCFGGRRLPLARTYGEHPRGALIALVNAFGVIEAACVQGRADDLLGLAPGSPVELRPAPAARRS